MLEGIIGMNKTLYADAISTFGIENQMMVAVEELAELQKEISKAFRGMFNEQNMIEEIADTEIMIEQVMYYFEISRKEVNAEKDLKLKRLKDRINDFWK